MAYIQKKKAKLTKAKTITNILLPNEEEATESHFQKSAEDKVRLANRLKLLSKS